jgi:acetolactate decarboxylase
VLFQVSTLAALLEGDYAGRTAYRAVMKRGDFGLGTFEALDGEMVAVDGVYYQIPADGIAVRVDPEVRTPFAAVTTFEADELLDPGDVPGCAELLDAISEVLPEGDLPVAIRVTGRFAKLQTRSVPAQSEPFPPLAEALADQVVFDLFDVDASLVGFWLPAVLADVNVAGFHFHAITADGTRGGHVLDCEPQRVQVELDFATTLEVQLGESFERRPSPADARPAREGERLRLVPW